MEKEITELLTENGFTKRKPADESEIESLKFSFGIPMPKDYENILRFSNGGSLYGFQSPIIIYSVQEVLALHHEFDLYQNIPDSLIFGGDGGGTIYTYDLRSDQLPILLFREDDTRYDKVVYKAENLTQMLKDIIAWKKIN